MELIRGDSANPSGNVFICSILDDTKEIYAYHGLAVPGNNLLSKELSDDYKSVPVSANGKFLVWSYKDLFFESIKDIVEPEVDVALIGKFENLHQAAPYVIQGINHYMMDYTAKNGHKDKTGSKGFNLFGVRKIEKDYSQVPLRLLGKD